MALVDYSGSEDSEEEPKPTVKEAVKPKTASNKPAFQKVVDPSAPHKIRVTLPESSKASSGETDSERPSKRTKLSTGGLGGFNALLPAPKRASATNGGATSSGSKKGGLGSGINLRTGAAPGFSRESEPSMEADQASAPDQAESKISVSSHEPGAEAQDGNPDTVKLKDLPAEDVKPKGKATMFKPLSVARKPPKKKATSASAIDGMKSGSDSPIALPKAAPKVSLFSAGSPDEISGNGSPQKGTYQPMIYTHNFPDNPRTYLDTSGESEPIESSVSIPDPSNTDQNAQSLDMIASDLNLSASAKRQLLGRQKNKTAAINIVNFNTDEEYKANEVLRQAGEQVQHNPVHAIAPGKHSLKQLVNMGTVQADALEESFASGRRNRSEAGSKYGW